MTSIHRQLTLSLLAATFVAFVVAGVLLHRTVRTELVDQFDVGLTAQARALAGLVEYSPRSGGVDFDYAPKAMPEYQGGDDPRYFTMWISVRDDARSSETLDGEALPRRAGALEAPDAWDMTLADGRPGRALGITLPVRVDDEDEDDDEEEEGDDDDEGAAAFAAADVPDLTVVVARSRTDLEARLATVVTGLGLAGLVVMALVGWGITVGIRRGLSPIGALSREVADIDATTLSRRVGAGGTPEELLPFADKLNELLVRLEGSFAKERRMTAAMAHELRTPIAELRTATDVAARWPDDEALSETAVATAGDVAVRMSLAIEAIMRYCRLEAGQAQPEFGTVLLHELVEELWAPNARQATERGLSFANDVPTDVAVGTDRGLLSIVIGNLLHNAASFASGGTVHAEVQVADGQLELAIVNATDQLVPDDLAHVHEAFWRKDAARTDGHHSGLGLTLVTSVADVLGYQACFALTGGRFRASVRIPAEWVVARPKAEAVGSRSER